MSKTIKMIAALTAALMTISSSALIQANAVEETLNVSLMSSSENETKEYNFNDIYAMATEEVLSLFAEKGLTKDKGYYVYGQGDDAEYVYCFSWNVYLFSEDFLSDRTVEEILNDYTPYQDVDCLYDKGESLWDTDRIVSALALPDEYFEITVFKNRVIVKGADSTDKNKIACNCEIRCKLPEGEKQAAMRNVALNYLQLRKDFDKLLIDDAVPYYGKEKTKTAAQKYGDAIAEYMANNDIQGVVSRSVPDEKLSIGFHGDHEAQLRAYISEIGLDKSGIPYEFEKLPDFGELNDLIVTTETETPDEGKKSTLKETAEDINEYMRSNGISGSTHVHEDDGVEKIFITYDGFFEKIKAYVVDTGVDESLVVYKQSQDHEAVTKASYKIVSLPDKLEYKLGEQIDLTGIQIEMSKGDEKAVVYTYPDVAFDYQSDIPKSPSVVLSTDFRSDIAGTYTVKVTDSENASFTVKVVDIADPSDTESSLKEDAESINEYMRSNGISGFTYVRAVDGVEKIFISYDGFFEEIQAYVKEKDIDENLVVYQQSYDYNTNESTLKGDTNCDGQVDLSDAVMVMQALANPNKYGIEGTAEHHLTEQGKANADMNGDGLTVGDAQSIQRKLLGLDKGDVQMIESYLTANAGFLYESGSYTIFFIGDGKYFCRLGGSSADKADDGTYTISGDTVELTGQFGTNRFRYEDNALIYIAEGSDGFDNVKPKDGEKFYEVLE